MVSEFLQKRTTIFLAIAGFFWSVMLFLRFHDTYQALEHRLLHESAAPYFQRILCLGLFGFLYLAFRKFISEQNDWDVLQSLWRIVATGMIALLTIEVLEYLFEWLTSRQLRAAAYVNDLRIQVQLGVQSFHFFLAFHFIGKLSQYKRSTWKARLWLIMEAMMVISLLSILLHSP
ncbi:MAG: hypothetical protein NZ108_10040, partial [Bacteroidia bacterium]|nr:hypothetical protein [Bacteroidia bacterium]